MLTILLGFELYLLSARRGAARRARERRDLGMDWDFSPRGEERHEMNGDAKNATEEWDGSGRGNRIETGDV